MYIIFVQRLCWIDAVLLQVEHETSAIGTRSITVFVMALAILVYFIFRRWMMMRAGTA